MMVLAVSALEKLRQVPLKNLAIFGLIILALILLIFLIKQAAGMNRIIFVIVSGTVVIVLLLNWIFQRTEPKFLTPMIDKIAPMFSGVAPQTLSGRPDKSDPSAVKNPAAPQQKEKPAAPPTNGQPTTTIRSKVY
jgi:hypothetical protein